MSFTTASDKLQTFNINIVIIEGRHYIWSHANTAVIVKIDNQKKSTSVRENSDNPLYNEYFVFEFNSTLENLRDKHIVITVIQPKTACRKRKTLGFFEFDANFVWIQPDHQFYHRWAILKSPKTEASRMFRGYLKIDVCILFKGQVPKLPVNVKNDDIEGNLLVQEEGILDRHSACFIFDIYKCINLVKKPINLIKSNCKEEDCGLTAYIEIIFAGQSVRSNVFRNTANPIINQRLIISDMFPTLCQRIKVLIRYSTKELHSSFIIDLKNISNSKEDGFLPTFGPNYVHLYTKQNMQGYAGSILMAVTTEIQDVTIKEHALIPKEIPKYLIDTLNLTMVDVYLFVVIMDVSLIPKKYTNKPLSIMVSQGNISTDIEVLNKCIDKNETNNIKKISAKYFHMQIEDTKPCFCIKSEWIEYQRRMYNSNHLERIVVKLKSYSKSLEDAITNKQFEDIDAIIEESLNFLTVSAVKYLDIVKGYNIAENGTKLEKERMRSIIKEMEDIQNNAKLIYLEDTKKDSFRQLLKKMRILEQFTDEAQNCWPDIFIWLVSGNKKVAGVQISSRRILHSFLEEERGELCNVEKNLFLTKSFRDSANNFLGKVKAKFWLGPEKNKRLALDIIPTGFKYDLNFMEPSCICSEETFNFQCFAHILQGKIAPGYDKSGLIDAFLVVYVKDKWNKTNIKYQSLNPIWDQTLVFRNITLYGSKEYLRENPPDIYLELYDHDRFSTDFVGCGLVKPFIKMKEDLDIQPRLNWINIHMEYELTAEILSAFVLKEVAPDEIDSPEKDPKALIQIEIPEDIKPSFKGYRMEVYFWGVRNLKHLNNLPIKQPRVDVVVQDTIVKSITIPNASKNPNFVNCIKTCELILPDEKEYCPPIRVKMFDSRPFGIYIFAGSFIGKIQPFVEEVMTSERRHKLLSELAYYSMGYLKPKSESIVHIKPLEPKTTPVVEQEKPKKEEEDKPFPTCKEIIAIFCKHFRESIKDIKEQQKKIPTPTPSIITYEDETTETEDYDWWTKFYASEKEPPKNISEKMRVPDKYTLKIYSSELENQPEFKGFTDTLSSFQIFKGKRTGDETVDEDKITGVFKGNIKLYRWPPEEEGGYVTATGLDLRENGIFRNFPSNFPMRYVLRVYCVGALNLTPKDVMGKSDPYLKVILNKQVINDQDNYIPNQVNPIFGRCYEFHGFFPSDHTLTIECWDWDRMTDDDLIGSTDIDIENRFYTKYRANCGIPDTYQVEGYCQWRDYQRPSQILKALCILNNVDDPEYEESSVKIGPKVFSIDPSLRRADPNENKQVMALYVLRRWNEMPLVGFPLVPEHVETRSLYHSSKPGIEQGKLQLWIDIIPFSEDHPVPPPVDITPRKPVPYELRVIIWNTQDVLLTEDDFFLGEKKSDIYVKGWLTSVDDAQSTDVHYRSLTGEGNFNWRFVFAFEYLPSENLMVFHKKENKFSRNLTEYKMPCKLMLQVWDNDIVSPDDFIGTISLELSRLPKGSPSPRTCDLNMIDPMARTINLFKVRRTKGWWPFYDIDKKTNTPFLTGKVEAELEIFSAEDAEKNPAGLGRDEPQSLPPPKRPDVSFSWFGHPWKAAKYLICTMHRTKIIMGLLFLMGIVFIGLAIYAFPGYLVKAILHA